MQIQHCAVDAVGQSEVVCIHDESVHWHECIKCRRREDDITVASAMQLASAEPSIVAPIGAGLEKPICLLLVLQLAF